MCNSKTQNSISSKGRNVEIYMAMRECRGLRIKEEHIKMLYAGYPNPYALVHELKLSETMKRNPVPTLGTGPTLLPTQHAQWLSPTLAISDLQQLSTIQEAKPMPTIQCTSAEDAASRKPVILTQVWYTSAGKIAIKARELSLTLGTTGKRDSITANTVVLEPAPKLHQVPTRSSIVPVNHLQLGDAVMLNSSDFAFVVGVEPSNTKGDWVIRTINNEGTIQVCTLAEEFYVTAVKQFEVAAKYLPTANARKKVFNDYFVKLAAIADARGNVLADKARVEQLYKILDSYELLGAKMSERMMDQVLLSAL